jgi:hypothetical protein
MHRCICLHCLRIQHFQQGTLRIRVRTSMYLSWKLKVYHFTWQYMTVYDSICTSTYWYLLVHICTSEYKHHGCPAGFLRFELVRVYASKYGYVPGRMYSHAKLGLYWYAQPFEDLP